MKTYKDERLLGDPYGLFSVARSQKTSNKQCVEYDNMHIFLNWDIYDVRCLVNMKRNHRVHVFLDEFMDSYYGDDRFFDFCSESYNITRRKVIIHIPPEDAKELKCSIKAKLDGFHEYKLKVERKPVYFKYGCYNYMGLKDAMKIIHSDKYEAVECIM